MPPPSALAYAPIVQRGAGAGDLAGLLVRRGYGEEARHGCVTGWPEPVVGPLLAVPLVLRADLGERRVRIHQDLVAHGGRPRHGIG